MKTVALPPDAHRAVVDFARDTLGCHCDPEVFRHIDLDADRAADMAFARIVIGARLLVWLVPGAAAERVEELAVAGLADRDAHGYNRFRLVLAEAGPDAVARFTMAAGGDAKAHLHIVPMAAWPAPARDIHGIAPD